MTMWRNWCLDEDGMEDTNFPLPYLIFLNLKFLIVRDPVVLGQVFHRVEYLLPIGINLKKIFLTYNITTKTKVITDSLVLYVLIFYNIDVLK